MTESHKTDVRNTEKIYDSGNIFAKILRKEIPAVSVYEDDRLLAFMDVMPQAEGHILLIPKAPYRNLLDADPDILPHFVKMAQKLAQAAQKAFHADGITIMQFNEEAGGQSVFHLHCHIIPRKANIPLRPHGTAMANAAELAAQAEKIRSALSLSL